MSKRLKNKKDKVPKITEDEYANYLSSLRGQDGGGSPPAKKEREKKEE